MGACAHLTQLTGRRVPRGFFVLDGTLFDFGLCAQFDHRLFEFFGFLLHPRDLATFLQLAIALHLHIHTILFSNAGLACATFLFAPGLGDILLPLRDLHVLARGFVTMVRPLVCAPDASKALELGASFLVLNKGASLGVECVQLGCYLFGKKSGDLVNALFFLAHHFLGLVFSFLKHARAGSFFDHAEDLFWTHVEHL